MKYFIMSLVLVLVCCSEGYANKKYDKKKLADKEFTDEQWLEIRMVALTQAVILADAKNTRGNSSVLKIANRFVKWLSIPEELDKTKWQRGWKEWRK